PPGGKGTTRGLGRLGQAPLWAVDSPAASARTAPAASAIRVRAAGIFSRSIDLKPRLALLARARSAHIGVVARRDAHIDDAHRAVTRDLDSLFYRGRELRRLRDRTDAFGALRARHHREVDVRSADALADPAVLHRARAFLRDALLVQLVVEEGTVVGDEDETGNAVVRGGPQGGRAHQEVAVAHDRDGDPAAALQRQRRTHCDPWAGAHA